MGGNGIVVDESRDRGQTGVGIGRGSEATRTQRCCWKFGSSSHDMNCGVI